MGCDIVEEDCSGPLDHKGPSLRMPEGMSDAGCPESALEPSPVKAEGILFLLPLGSG